MFEMIRPFRCSWYLSAYSIASMPPHEWPEQVEVVLVQAERLAHLFHFVDEAIDS